MDFERYLQTTDEEEEEEETEHGEGDAGQAEDDAKSGTAAEKGHRHVGEQ